MSLCALLDIFMGICRECWANHWVVGWVNVPIPSHSLSSLPVLLNAYLFIMFMFIREREAERQRAAIPFELLEFTLQEAHILFPWHHLSGDWMLLKVEKSSPLNNLKAPIGGPLHYYRLSVYRFVCGWALGHLCLHPVIAHYLRYFKLCLSLEPAVDFPWLF